MNTCFRPGEEWLDTDGKPIQAHGGSVIYADGKYYWFGEKQRKTLPDSGIWHWGVRLYSSEDLYNWKDEGIIVPPSEDYEIRCTRHSIWTDRILSIMQNKRNS